MNFSRLEIQLMEDEGFRAKPYIDSRGFWTIGYGSRWILGTPVDQNTAPITSDVARQLLRAHLYKSILDVEKTFPRAREMNDIRHEVLVNLTYNVGARKIMKFRRLQKAASELNYPAMAMEMKYRRPPAVDLTPWYTQTARRSIRMVEQMRTGIA